MRAKALELLEGVRCERRWPIDLPDAGQGSVWACRISSSIDGELAGGRDAFGPCSKVPTPSRYSQSAPENRFYNKEPKETLCFLGPSLCLSWPLWPEFSDLPGWPEPPPGSRKPCL